MDIEQILALIAALEPELLSFIQAIVTAVNPPPTPAMDDKAIVSAITPEQKAMLTSLMQTKQNAHAMLCDAMSKNYGITV